MSAIWNTSGQHETQSTHVRQLRKLLEYGNGPTRSIWMCSNRALLNRNSATGLTRACLLWLVDTACIHESIACNRVVQMATHNLARLGVQLLCAIFVDTSQTSSVYEPGIITSRNCTDALQLFPVRGLRLIDPTRDNASATRLFLSAMYLMSVVN